MIDRIKLLESDSIFDPQEYLDVERRGEKKGERIAEDKVNRTHSLVVTASCLREGAFRNGMLYGFAGVIARENYPADEKSRQRCFGEVIKDLRTRINNARISQHLKD